jgi:carbonic anhydrase
MASADPKDIDKYLQQSHDRIFENNRAWAEEQRTKNPEFFEKLNAGQAPEYLWIGEFCVFCSTPGISER